MAYLEYFDRRVLDLQRELENHPPLMQILSGVPASEPTVRLGHIAAYCEVILDGIYTGEELYNLCEVLNRKLREKRTLVLLP